MFLYGNTVKKDKNNFMNISIGYILRSNSQQTTLILTSFLCLFARLIKRQVVVFRSFGRRSSYRIYCQCGRLRRADEKVVGVMRRMTTVMAMIARCGVDTVYVLTKDSTVTGVQLYRHSSCLPWQSMFGCSISH